MKKRVSWRTKVRCTHSNCHWCGEVEDLAPQPLEVKGELSCPWCHERKGEFDYNSIVLHGAVSIS
jgi:hypothetical protein